MTAAPEVPKSEPELATPPRSAPANEENADPAPTNDQARSNGSSQAEQDNGGKGGNETTSGGEARPSKSRPPLPRPEGTVNCPRCTSTETKFCYYNNYNVKQPRYFCKVSSEGLLLLLAWGDCKPEARLSSRACGNFCLTDRKLLDQQ